MDTQTVTPDQLRWVLNALALAPVQVAEVLQNQGTIQTLVGFCNQPNPIGPLAPIEARPKASVTALPVAANSPLAPSGA